MARINVETSLWADPRVQDFMIVCGSRKLAKAHLLEAFEIAQKYWVPDRKSVPRQDLERMDIPVDDMLKLGLAETRDDGIYVKGSEEQFAWLIDRVESGRKGGQSKSELKTKHLKQNRSKTEAGPKQNRSGTEAKPKQTEASSSSSSSFSSSFSSSSSSSSSDSSFFPPDPGRRRKEPVSQQTWVAYGKAFRQRWDTDPVRNATVNSQMAQFVRRVGEADAPEIARFFLTHNDRYYVQKMHAVGLMLKDAEKLYAEFKRKRKVTSDEARSAESRDHYTEQLKRLGGSNEQ